MKKLVIICFLIPYLFLAACTMDKVNDITGTGGGTLNLSIPTSPDDRFRVSYDMIKSKSVIPVHPSDEAQLTNIDKIMQTPVFEGFHVELAVTADGSMMANIDKVNFPELPAYPDNTVYPYPEDPEDLARIEIRDDVVHCYNREGELIGSGSPFVPQSLMSMMNGIRASEALPSDQIQIAVQAFNDAGIILNATEMEGVYLHDLVLEDGSSVKTLLDFELGVQLGQAGYYSDGSLNYKTNVNIEWDETQEKVILTGHRFVTRARSPMSDVEVEIIESSQINNYQFELLN